MDRALLDRQVVVVEGAVLHHVVLGLANDHRLGGRTLITQLQRILTLIIFA